MQDPIADMLTRIRNNQAVGKDKVSMPASRQKINIAMVLKDEGYINGYKVENENNKKVLCLNLKYYLDKPVIELLKKISKPGLRVYRKSSELPKVMGGLGIAIISTSKGIMSDRAARAINQGGEVIAIIA